ncbi:hypothetical protein Pmani_026873 [Petrolisthes manimaculis]|uniref:Uncharacterized protein n=1 Tax=Petrolisthes manimaculis TaxID=1843537 RepID=A0AAE1P3V1_9EUCA|nr:hypothetical protein Pmani_026873 [Petrolisthes manimaculis]
MSQVQAKPSPCPPSSHQQCMSRKTTHPSTHSTYHLQAFGHPPCPNQTVRLSQHQSSRLQQSGLMFASGFDLTVTSAIWGADESEQSISILLNNQESEVVFVNVATPKEVQAEATRSHQPDGWMMMYSITDKASFQRIAEELQKLNSMGLLRGRAVIVVANKCELVRSRAVNLDDGRDLACSYGAKFMEISVGMNHKCDDLLVGVLNQLRIKGEADPSEKEELKESSWKRNQSLVRASMKAKRVINRIMGKTEAKYKKCEDFDS